MSVRLALPHRFSQRPRRLAASDLARAGQSHQFAEREVGRRPSVIARAMGRISPAMTSRPARTPFPHQRLRCDDRRRFPRRLGHCSVRILRDRDSKSPADRDWAFRATPLRGQMLDVSISGVAFLVSEPISPGTSLYVELRHPHRDKAVVRKVLVADRLLAENGRWKILCQLEQRLSFEEVTALSVEPTV